jgi:MFS family permease
LTINIDYLRLIYSGKFVLGIGFLIASLMTLLTPLVVAKGKWWLICARVLAGFGEGYSIV